MKSRSLEFRITIMLRSLMGATAPAICVTQQPLSIYFSVVVDDFFLMERINSR
jgi:hypothetical protein